MIVEGVYDKYGGHSTFHWLVVLSGESRDITTVMSPHVWRKLLAVFLFLFLYSSTTRVQGQLPCTADGWWGDDCRYACHCYDDQPCNTTTGDCGRVGCQAGWFGPSCQHVDLASGQQVTITNITQLATAVVDNDDNSCLIADALQVSLDRKYSTGWIRLISVDTEAWANVSVAIADTATGTSGECTTEGSRTAQWVAGGVLDVYCGEMLNGDRVEIVSGTNNASLCSLHVDGGRNVAVGGAATQSGTFSTQEALRSVDGNTDRRVVSQSCSYTSDKEFSFGCGLLAMRSDPWWQVELSHEVKVTRFLIHTRQNEEERLAGVQLFGGNPDYELLYQHPDSTPVPDVIRVPVYPPVTVDRVGLLVPGDCQILTFCELEVYGERVCPNGTFGTDCQSECRCRDVTEVCHHVTGGCVTGCRDGYTGIGCQQECNGTYGRDCSQPCSSGCREGKCDHVTGNCTLGCDVGFYDEPKCQRPCPPGFYGPNCDRECPANCLNGTCNVIGYCEGCEPGYDGLKCEAECPAGRHGAGCEGTCSFHCDVLKCDHVTGICDCKEGWQPPLCLEPCAKTYWGRNCVDRCNTGCVDQDCDAINGDCQHGCQPGFLGPQCNIKCGPGKFGQDCQQTCSTSCQDAVCDHVSGKCTNCPAGFTGDFCDRECGLGTWGSRCTETCSINCRGAGGGGPGGECSPTDGTCNNGCVDGFQGIRCLNECSAGSFGANCTMACSTGCREPANRAAAPCHHVTGNCLTQGCKEGFAGAKCAPQPAAASAAMLGAVIGGILAIVVIVLIIFFVIRRRKTKQKMVSSDSGEVGNVRLSAAYANVNHAYVDESKQTIEDEDEASDVCISIATGSEGEREKQVYYNTSPALSRTRVATKDLAASVARWRANPQPLIEQFQNLPTGLISTTSVALNVSNKGKNRYKNICAYDNSRVKLNVLDGDPNSDYINASYVNGPDGEPRFIASQGPNSVILHDFLRMLWEKHINIVVMLTNPYEGDKHKCEQYWPDHGEKKFGSVTVTLLNSRTTADYVIRTLQLAKEGRKIEVTQHHFTSWPDKGVPVSPWPLVDFHMTVNANAAAYPDSPIVVHCSAGIGRTGTYIALDNLLTEAAATHALDFNTCVWKLRQARVNMIQTVDQYIFLHEAVLVGLTVAGTLHSKNTLPDAVTELERTTPSGHTKMEAEFRGLEDCQVDMDDNEYTAGRQEDNITKNRFYNILPKDSHRPLLTSSVPGTNDYINAVFLPGYRNQNHYVVTQLPLASTVVDVWRLVAEYPISTVVCFSAPPLSVGDTAPEMFPDEGESHQYGPYKVSRKSVTTHNGYEEGFIHFIKAKRFPLGRGGRNVRVIRCTDNNPGSPLLLAISQAAIFGVPSNQLDDNLILVICRTGGEMSGVFVALSQLLQRLEEAPVSVPAVVGNLRTLRPQIVSSFDQYKMVYDALKLYSLNSSVYSNMEPGTQGPPKPKPERKEGGKKKSGKGQVNGEGAPAENGTTRQSRANGHALPSVKEKGDNAHSNT